MDEVDLFCCWTVFRINYDSLVFIGNPSFVGILSLRFLDTVPVFIFLRLTRAACEANNPRELYFQDSDVPRLRNIYQTSVYTVKSGRLRFPKNICVSDVPRLRNTYQTRFCMVEPWWSRLRDKILEVLRFKVTNLTIWVEEDGTSVCARNAKHFNERIRNTWGKKDEGKHNRKKTK